MGSYIVIFFYNQKQKFAMGDMERANQSDVTDFIHNSEVTDFILVGIKVCPELYSVLFLLFLWWFFWGNFNIIGIVVTEPGLNTPMYLFLGNLCHWPLLLHCYCT